MPTAAEIAPLQQTLAAVLAGEPRRHHALTVVPILAPMQAEPEWLTLAEAGDRVRTTEISEGGSVPDLRVANLGDLPLLLLAGEQPQYLPLHRRGGERSQSLPSPSGERAG